MSRDLPDGDDSASGDDWRTDGADADEGQLTLRLEEIDRIFSIVEQLLRGDRLDREQTNRLIELFERAVANPVQTDPETIAELVSMVEELIVRPDDLEDATVERLLAVFEQALAGTGTDRDRSDDILSVVEAALRDPATIDPDDIERFRTALTETVTEMTDPFDGPLGQLFGIDDEELDLEAVDDSEFESVRLARLGAAMTQRATGYSLESGLRTGTRMGYAALNARSPAELLTEIRAITLDELQRSGVDIGERRSEWLAAHEDAVDERPVTADQLRRRGERLLSKSADVGRDEAFHPSYPSILDDLAGDEARILRLLATDGMQASLDVYDRQYIPFKAHLIARNLSMVGTDAGCRHPERTPIYLQNLHRLGLVRFSDEPVENLKRYQVLDAQPHIEAAIETANRPRTVYGSIQLTELGIDFCENCLPVTVDHSRQRRRFRTDSAPDDTADTPKEADDSDAPGSTEHTE
ncbi:DUF4393 domain-containing protein [Halovenus sp. WSH3]|uniref:DUF4393 domain-containing protein n=1 Tax=Halovenus carboxidivorans TaxID=2692199 RepID=A0A6B0T9D5_9EURY|nr:Abi-alpha family protein [Halovenus carboxidivorans]MXR52856.1 DUF4393 domain-containing protein [Halovenus carboxidivorans]